MYFSQAGASQDQDTERLQADASADPQSSHQRQLEQQRKSKATPALSETSIVGAVAASRDVDSVQQQPSELREQWQHKVWDDAEVRRRQHMAQKGAKRPEEVLEARCTLREAQARLKKARTKMVMNTVVYDCLERAIASPEDPVSIRRLQASAGREMDVCAGKAEDLAQAVADEAQQVKRDEYYLALLEGRPPKEFEKFFKEGAFDAGCWPKHWDTKSFLCYQRWVAKDVATRLAVIEKHPV